ncbi:MAG: peroxiredoxin [Gemmatimonadetes bacterium]|nr:peroxiredoxin [Gemmatimonadota bacterium]
MSDHHYRVTVRWTGNTGTGTSAYRAYERAHEISAGAKPAIAGSSDPNFRGDAQRWNPEELLVASLSACHKLWFLHLSADAGVVVTAYEDHAEGTMAETPTGGGRFTRVLLRPSVTVQGQEMVARIEELHHRAHELCFIANSVNFEVLVEGDVQVG